MQNDRFVLVRFGRSWRLRLVPNSHRPKNTKQYYPPERIFELMDACLSLSVGLSGLTLLNCIPFPIPPTRRYNRRLRPVVQQPFYRNR